MRFLPLPFFVCALTAAMLSPAAAAPTTVVMPYSEATALLQEVQRLRDWFDSDPDTKKIKLRRAWDNTALLQDALRAQGLPAAQLATQTMVVVDRNPQVQHAWVLLQHRGLFIPVADAPVSTGAKGRFDYYLTPTGVFAHTGDIVGYRAQGTKNEQGVRGLGRKGMRVWDFGWQKAQTGWLKRPEVRLIRFEMHATDPDLLEQRLGKPASKGCVRVYTAFNRFIDQHAILDGDILQREDTKYSKALLPAQLVPTKAPGKYLVVLDSTPANESPLPQ